MSTADLSRRFSKIMTFDGGGLYGLTAAYWTRQLCKLKPGFLGEVTMFAGTSAGAINALVLASEENPETGVDKLVHFWHEAGVFSNSNPMTLMGSMLGLNAWYGTADLLGVLDRYLGKGTKLADLKHPVMVTSYNWHGGEVTFPDTDAGLGWAAAPMPAATGPGRRWAPHLFTNFLKQDEGRGHRAVDVAYAATAMPTMRAVRGGAGDGGIYTGNPTVEAISAAVMHEHEHVDADLPDHPGDDYDYDDHFVRVLGVLAPLSLLSLGDGSFQPWYLQQNFNFGILPWLLPVNPLLGFKGLWAPSNYSLQPAEEMVNEVSRRLLGMHYYRLNPGVLEFPTAATVYVSRNPLWRQWLIEYIRTKTETAVSHEAVRRAAAFLDSPHWDVPPPPTPR